MRTFLFTLGFVFLFASHAQSQTTFTLQPSQSMIMTGKGKGQDATINPYYGQECIAVVKNIGMSSFSIRVQLDGKVIEEVPIQKGEIKKVKLLKNYRLYLDPNPTQIAKASVAYEKSKE